MKRSILLALISLYTLLSKGQNNLVPNWSFEDHVSCPTSLGKIYKAEPWFPAQRDTAASSTDLFDTCGAGTAKVPHGFGFQYPRTGNAYAGFILYVLYGSYKEYAEVKLLSALVPGKSYCVSFHVNFSNLSQCNISSIGAAFSHDTLLSLAPPYGNYTINMSPDILSAVSTNITDTLNWTEINGMYQCNTSVNFITIGNFFSTDISTHVSCGPNPTTSYYYLDDVSVVEVSNANAGNDTSMCAGQTIPIGGPPTFAADYTWYELADSSNSSSIDSIHIANPHISPTQTTTYVMQKQQCNVVTRDTVTVTVNCVGIKQEEKKPEWVLYPNPANEQIRISYAGAASEIVICNVLGKEIQTLSLKNGMADMNTTNLSEGFYFFNLLSGSRIIASQKVLIRH